MVIAFTRNQQQKLGDVYLDIGKGLILASFAGPALSPALNFLVVLRPFVAGVIIIYFGLILSDSHKTSTKENV